MIIHWHLKLKKKKRKKESCQICSSNYQKKKRKDEKGSSSSNTKSSSISVNTVEKDKNYVFIVEKILYNKDNLSQFELKKILNKSQSKKEFVRKLEDQLDIEKLTTEKIFSIIKPTYCYKLHSVYISTTSRLIFTN